MDTNYQLSLSFPDILGHVDDTLAMNNMAGFTAYKGQGYLKFRVDDEVESFSVFVNNRKLMPQTHSQGSCCSFCRADGQMPDGEFCADGRAEFTVDISDLTVNGMNCLMISDVMPEGLMQKIHVDIPYPVVTDCEPGLNEKLLEEAGIAPAALRAVEEIVKSDIAHGFTSASMALIKDGKMVYKNCWGRKNSYEQDGRPKEDGGLVTTDTLYDLASNTKMYSVNYAIQYLQSEGLINIENKVTDYLGMEFAENVIDLKYEGCEDPGLEGQKEWKRSLTVKDILRHQAGFPADPRFFFEKFDQRRQAHGDVDNILFSGNDGSSLTRQRTLDALFKTPMMYRPGTQTVYSDADYMLLGFIVEKVTGKDLNTFLKETFWEPMGLSHITFNPLDNGFSAGDCAATELNGNSRDGAAFRVSTRSETLQGKVHDEKAWCCMGGISGHAGLFASAQDLAKLAFVMLSGGYGEHRFFSKGTVDTFTAPQRETTANWGLGWNRQGEMQRSWYFSPLSSRGTVGHQGWTGTLSMIDPEKHLVLVFLTNKINSPVTNVKKNPDRFDGNWFTSSSLGFAAQLIYLSFVNGDLPQGTGRGLDAAVAPALCSLVRDMVKEKQKLVDAAEAQGLIEDARYDEERARAIGRYIEHPILRAKAAIEEAADSICKHYYMRRVK